MATAPMIRIPVNSTFHCGSAPSMFRPMLITPTISTLNFSDVPVILLESGNMRNSSDAARMSSPAGQRQYADWIVAGLRSALRA